MGHEVDQGCAGEQDDEADGQEQEDGAEVVFHGGSLAQVWGGGVMAYLGFNLRISDGETTVYLGTAEPLAAGVSGCQLLAYPLAEPGETLRTATSGGDGAVVLGVRRENVAEGATVSIGATFADARAVLGTVNRLLRQAEESQQYGRGLPVFLELDALGDGVYWRSEVLAGRAAVEGGTLGGYWKGRGRLQRGVRWLRRPYWEGAEAELPLGNRLVGGEMSYVTGGLALANHSDWSEAVHPGDTDWLEVDPAAAGAGDLPAPVRLGLQVGSGAVQLRRVVVAGGLLAPASPWLGEVGWECVGPFVEAEGVAEGTLQAGDDRTLYSDGFYRLFAAPGAIETELATLTLPAEWLAGGGREFLRVVMRLVGAVPSGARVRLRLKSAAGYVWDGPVVILEAGHELQDLGVVQLPPGNLSASADLYLDLCGVWTVGTIGVDYLAFLPLVSYRRYAPAGVGVGLGVGDWLVDDGMLGQVYIQSGADVVPGVLARGGQLVVHPHLTAVNRFWVLGEDALGAAAASRAYVVRAWWRPRRASL